MAALYHPAKPPRCFSIWRSSATAGTICPASSLSDCSLGATHAVNLYLRRPDIFCGCLALSGIYTAHYGFGDYMDELVYMNSPVDYMKNFPEITPICSCSAARKRICCGQGGWEQPDTTWLLKRIFEAKHIPIWVDLWGHDVNHDWNWWYKRIGVLYALHSGPAVTHP